MCKRLALALALTAGLSGCGGTKGDFVSRVDNPWFPLEPGRTLRYVGSDEGTPVVDLFTVTHRTKRILGVDTTVVHDRLFKRGRLAEDTLDWYAQDRHGNVWYFGESTKELDAHGRVTSREGSWQAGVDGAQQGIFMPADPKVGQSFRQEYYKGHAEDHFRITQLAGDRMRTEEWSPIEPGVLDAKYYRRGTGTVRERSVKGGSERLALIGATGG